MRSILSAILAAALLMGALTACTGTRARVEESRATATPRPAATVTPTATPKPESVIDDMGDAVGDAAENTGEAVGDVARGAGEAVNDLVGDGRVTDEDGMIEDMPEATAAPRR